jgi:hypothetical protein
VLTFISPVFVGLKLTRIILKLKKERLFLQACSNKNLMCRLYPHSSTFGCQDLLKTISGESWKKSKIIGLQLQLSLLRGRSSAELVEKVVTSNMGLVQ